MADSDEKPNITISHSAAILMLVAGLGTGAGGISLVGRDQSAMLQCIDNSRTALDVAAQHGKEFLVINQRIEQLRQDLFDRTANRYDSERASADWERQGRRDELQDQRLNHLDRYHERGGRDSKL